MEKRGASKGRIKKCWKGKAGTSISRKGKTLSVLHKTFFFHRFLTNLPTKKQRERGGSTGHFSKPAPEKATTVETHLLCLHIDPVHPG